MNCNEPPALRQVSIYNRVKRLLEYLSNFPKMNHSTAERVLESLEVADKIDPSRHLALVYLLPLHQIK